MNVPDQFELLGRVSSTGSSTVFKGQDRRLDRLVALKLLDEDTPVRRAQWRAEAATLAGLQHPNVVEVYSYLESEDSAFLVEEWIDGATLSAVLAHTGALTGSQALGVIRGALLGLAHAHERGIVHGDISPTNILLDTTGVSRLIDFGLAAPTGSAARPATAAYHAPEAGAGGSLTPATDVYSAAAVLAMLLRGAASPQPSLTGVDRSLRPVLTIAMSEDPLGRYPDAAAFLAALEEAARRRYGAVWWTEAGLGAAAAGVVGTFGAVSTFSATSSAVASGSGVPVESPRGANLGGVAGRAGTPIPAGRVVSSTVTPVLDNTPQRRAGDASTVTATTTPSGRRFRPNRKVASRTTVAVASVVVVVAVAVVATAIGTHHSSHASQPPLANSLPPGAASSLASSQAAPSGSITASPGSNDVVVALPEPCGLLSASEATSTMQVLAGAPMIGTPTATLTKDASLAIGGGKSCRWTWPQWNDGGTPLSDRESLNVIELPADIQYAVQYCSLIQFGSVTSGLGDYARFNPNGAVCAYSATAHALVALKSTLNYNGRGPAGVLADPLQAAFRYIETSK